MKFIQFIIIQVDGNKNIIRYAQLENTKNINIDNNENNTKILVFLLFSNKTFTKFITSFLKKKLKIFIPNKNKENENITHK